jgi:hypothetical protein
MIGFIALLVSMAIVATVWTVWKYRRDIILGMVAWVAFHYWERRR